MYIPSWTWIIAGVGTFAILNIVTYAISAGLGHSRALLPFISLTGITAPENGIFVINFALTAFFLFFVISIRYLHAKEVVKKSLAFSITNFVVLLIGVIGLFMTLSLAAFEGDDAYWPHYIAAILAIFFNYVYGIAQTFIGIMLPPHKTLWKWVVFGVQLGMTILGFLLFLYFVIAGYVYPTSVYVEYRNNLTSIGNDTELIAAYYTGLNIDYTRALAEWLILVEIIAYFLTFIPDFNRVRFIMKVSLRFEEDSLYKEVAKPI